MRDSTEVDQGNGGILAVAAAKDMEALSLSAKLLRQLPVAVSLASIMFN
jgi:hypothetical protein